MNHFENAVDALDAAIFSSDYLFDEENRGLLLASMARWQRELAQWTEASGATTESPESVKFS